MRSRFARSALQGASPGLSNLAAALAGGANAEQQGYLSGMERESAIARALAQVRAADANAEQSLAAAESDRAKTAVLGRRPQMFSQAAAGAAGVDIPTLDAFQARQRGEMPQVPMGPPTEMGDMGVGTAQFGAESGSKIAQALTRFAPLLANTGDIKPDDWAGMLASYRNADLGDSVLAGERTPGQVGAAQAAVAGKPLYNSDPNGAVLNLFGGTLDTSSPIAQGTIAVKKETAKAQKANAAQSYASADNSRASAAKTRAEMAEGVNRGGLRAPTGYRWSAGGTSLEAIPGGPADPNTKGAKLSKPPTEGQAKSLMFAARMAVADDLLSSLADKGVKRPGVIKDVAETIGNIAGLGTDTFGGALSDAAGSMTNWTQSAEQQQVEQAQRDFINAVLRRESGAVISPGEFRNAAKQYFPQPGDSPDTLRQKAANRRTSIAGLQAEFGEALMPEFNRIVGEARKGSVPAGKQPRNTVGATGSWGDGWSIQKVD